MSECKHDFVIEVNRRFMRCLMCGEKIGVADYIIDLQDKNADLRAEIEAAKKSGEFSVEQMRKVAEHTANMRKKAEQERDNLQEIICLARKVSLDLCQNCDLIPSKCNGFAFKDIECINWKLREAIRKAKYREAKP